MKTLIADIETDGLLVPMTRIHCIVMRDAVTRETQRYRRWDGGVARWAERQIETNEIVLREQEFPAENTIEEGVRALQEADVVVFHNGIGFDVKAIQKIYPWFAPQCVRDTLVLTRLIVSDVKERDLNRIRQGQFTRGKASREVELLAAQPQTDLVKAALVEQTAIASKLTPGEVPGLMVGKHTLDAWGFRVGLHKGTYSKDMEAMGLNPWAQWNPGQEDYCENDIDVTEVLWAAIRKENPSQGSVELEHAITDLTSVMEANGFPFDAVAAKELATKLRFDLEALLAEAIPAFGKWAAPATKWQVRALWDDPKGVNRKKTYNEPRPEFGEDYSRAVWGGVTVPKRAARFVSSVHPDLCADGATHSYRSPDAPFCKMVMKTFLPTSRVQIIDRFTTIYSWEPAEFSDKGNPTVDDDVLRALGESIPVAKACAEIFFVSKILGYIESGRYSWLNTCDPMTGSIHGHINTGGTPTGRCSHLAPNIAQVPRVVVADVVLKNGSYNPLLLNEDGELAPQCYRNGVGLATKKMTYLLGRPGRYGYECRSLFFMPPPFKQVGVDLSSIEFRCLAELCAEFDNGELIEVVLKGDIHQYNKDKSGVETRDIAKRCLYALMYGAGDFKLGITAYPHLATRPEAAIRAGALIRAQLMEGVPALRRAIEKIKAQAKNGFIYGLDGRKVKIRSEHSALNFKLQGDAALIAKVWAILTEYAALDAGMVHSWAGDFVMVAFVHDELQNGVHEDCADEFAQLSIAAAPEAGKFFKFRCPVAAEAKIGSNWAECH